MGIAGNAGPAEDPPPKLAIGKLNGVPPPIGFCENVNAGATNAVFVVGGIGGKLNPTAPPVGTIP